MIYELDDNFENLSPVTYWDFGHYSRKEKDLENIIAKNLFSVLFEQTPLLPIHQERARQPEADIYALNEDGDLTIFELKRGAAYSGALDQLFRYTENASNWTYKNLSDKFRNYPYRETETSDLQTAHQEVFELDIKLAEAQFNRQQHMCVIGNAADSSLIDRVKYWRSRGLSIDFLPYRIYEIADRLYFEFFAKPYDEHYNPTAFRGILFDTNRSYNEDSLKDMISKKRIAAYGSRKQAVKSLKKGDFVFYSHKGCGIVAAAEITGTKVQNEGSEELYWDVRFLTNVPTDFNNIKALSFRDVKKITKKNFFWARIQKVPYLNRNEADMLLEALNSIL